jgi:hypothetical protein
LNLTTSATLLAHLRRAQAVLARSIPPLQRNWGTLATSLQAVLDALPAAITAKQAAREGVEDKDIPAVMTVVRLATALVAPRGELQRLRQQLPGDRDYATLFELLLDIMNAGIDSTEGQRFIYSSHAYAITDVNFQPRLRPDHLDADLPQLDPVTSTVTLRNPHHGNPPNPLNEPQPPGHDTGAFTLTLDQFFRNFDQLDSGLVRKTQ